MNRKQLSVAIALSAVFSVPAFAQGGGSGSGAASGTAGAGTAGTPAPASISSNVDKNTGSQAQSATGGSVSSSGHTGVSSGTGLPVTSGTGVAVTPSAPLAGAAHGTRHIYGSAVVPYNTTTVLGGPAPGVTSSTTTITHAWVNVPADAQGRHEFQRWQSLK
jgi:hypothetical protein